MQARIINMKQKEKLSELIHYVSLYNAYYRELFKSANINFNGDVEEIIQKIPITSKKDIRDNYNRYISTSNEEFVVELTSGSTGIPLRCVKSKSERVVASLNIWNQRRMWDRRINFTNFVNLFGEKVYTEIGNFIELDNENSAKFFNKLIDLSPRWISGPISVMEKYAKLIENGSVRFKKNQIRFIEFMGECVTNEQRQYIEDVFECTTINHYGTKETWCVAYECPNKNLHIQDDLIYLEAINKGKFGNSSDGEIVLTSLYNKLMPFVRYNLNDIGQVIYDKCDCGRSSPIVKLAGGRTGDLIKGRDILGNNFFNRIINRLMKNGHDCIESFRAEQVELNKFVIYIVKEAAYSEETSRLLIDLIKQELGPDTKVEIIFAEKIPRLPSGKVKNFHSHLNV